MNFMTTDEAIKSGAVISKQDGGFVVWFNASGEEIGLRKCGSATDAYVMMLSVNNQLRQLQDVK